AAGRITSEAEEPLGDLGGDGGGVLAAVADVALAGEDVAEPVDALEAAERAALPVVEVVELAAGGDAGDGLGDGADGADDERRADLEVLALEGDELPVAHGVLLEDETREPAVALDGLDGAREPHEAHEVFVLHARHDLDARRLGLGDGARVASLGGRDGHVLHAAAVDERAAPKADGLGREAVLLERLGDPARVELLHVDPDAALAEEPADDLEVEDLGDVDGREPAAHDERAVGAFDPRAVVAGVFVVIEPVDERVLVEEPAADEAIDALDGQRPIAPGAVGEDDGREPELVAEGAERDVAPQLGARDEEHARVSEGRVDLGVLGLAELAVPAREPVFDLSVRLLALFEHEDGGSPLGEDGRGFRAGDGSADERDDGSRGVEGREVGHGLYEAPPAGDATTISKKSDSRAD